MRIEITRNRVYIGVAIAIAVLGLLWMFFRPAAIPVETAKAIRSPLLETVDAEGRTRVRNKVTITAPVSGKLKRIGLREGDYIMKNYPVTEIDPAPPIPRSPNEHEDHPNSYAAKIFAPISGRVLRIFEESERFLGVGTPLLELGDPSNIEVMADVLSTDAVKIRPGSRMLIDSPASGEPLRAQIRTIEPHATTKVSALGVEEKRVDVVADFIDQKPTLGDNFRLDVRIVIWQGENVLSVPNSALFRSGDDWNLYVVKGGRAYVRNVEIGHRSTTDTQILNGVEEGEIVVIHPPNRLTDGARVTEE